MVAAGYGARPSAAAHPHSAMARRLPLLLLAAGLVSLLFFVLADTGADGDAGGVVRSGSGAGRAVDGGAALVGVEGDSDSASSNASVARRDAVEVEVDGARLTDAPDLAGEAAGRPVQARLVVLDPELGPRLQESGVIVVHPWEAEGESESVRLEVVRGQFDRSALVLDSYRIRRATMDSTQGPRDVLFDDVVFEVLPEEDLLLQGRYVPVRTLRALDASTGRDLERVSVLARHPGREPPQGSRHPGPHFPSQFVLRDATSPVTLPTARGVRQYWVTAAGHDWALVTVDHETAGESVVRLDSGGRLLVEVSGPTDHVGRGGVCTLIVLDSDGEVTVTTGLDGSRAGSTTQGFDGLPAGPTEVLIAVGSTHHRTVPAEVLASTSVVLRPYGETVARLSLGQAVFAKPVPARLEIHGEPDQLDAVSGLSHRPADGVERHGHDVGDMTWEFLNRVSEEGPLTRRLEGLTPGPHRFVVAPFMQVERVDVLERLDADAHVDGPERTLQTIRLELEPARVLTVRVVDALGGAPVEKAAVTWAPVLDPPLVPPVTDQAEVAEGEEALLVPLADGEYVLTARAPHHAPASATVRVTSQGQEIRLELEPRQPREVVLVVDGRRQRWPEGARCSILRRGDDREDAIAYEPAEGALFANAPLPGIYDLEIRGLGPSRNGERALRVSVQVDEDDPMRIVLAR